MKNNSSEFWQRELKISRRLLKIDYEPQLLIIKIITIALTIGIVAFIVITEIK